MSRKREEVPALRFRQWLKSWDELTFNEEEHRRRPLPEIYLFSMRAEQLRALSGVFRRRREGAIATGIQRGHDKRRSKEIRDFVRYGYPYSEMSESRRNTFDSSDLRKPGWLPTAIVVNVLAATDARRGLRVDPKDLVFIEQSDNGSSVILPKSFSASAWVPTQLPPIEIIDGQHRLFAFEGEMLEGDFELPVVAFNSLDIGWQAYLFWSINVSPKKINPSHAFDLYPLLRSQDWLEKFAESNVYREARAQELTEFMFSSEQSPWRGRINMLGEKGVRGVSQAAWIRALSSTFLSAGGRGKKGLFGCSITPSAGPLRWTRPQQAALLIELWNELKASVLKFNSPWTATLRQPDKRQSSLDVDSDSDPAFSGPHTILNQEQGVRGVLSVSNDVLFACAEQLSLDAWETDDDRGTNTADEEISLALDSLRQQAFMQLVRELTRAMASYDWRSADAAQLSEEEKLKKRAFRGSGGYVAIRDDLMRHISEGDGQVAVIAQLLHAKK